VLSDFYVTKNITYTADPTVSYYEIYRSTNKTKGFSLVGTSKTAGFSDYYLLAGKTYYYKVRSVKIVGGKKQYSKYQPTQTVMTNPLPTISTEMVATSAVGAIDFQWTIVYDMSAIQVYYATTNDKKTKWKVVTVNTNKFSLRNLTANKLYYVKYRYVYNKGNVSYGPFSKPIEIKTN